jgi:signal transduction histidine kinase/CheY-like chemotaxis protein/HPt (histidine-containing phosphotransfer) domain-containing protein
MTVEADGQDQQQRLAAENARLRRLTETLMDRVEQATSSANTPFGFFQINAALAEQLAQQRAALHDSRQTLQAIFHAAPVGLLLFSDDLVIRSANEYAAGMLGPSAQEVVGQPLGPVLGCAHGAERDSRCGHEPGCADCVWHRLLEDTRQSGRAQCEYELVRPARPGAAGGSVWLSLKAERVEIAGRRHLLLSLEDISPKKLAERQLREAKEAAEEASRLKSRFLSNVSHEVRTPLNGIMGFAEAILTSTTLEAAREQSQVILRESNVLLMLVNDLLDLVKIESGKLVLEHVPTDLGQTLRELSQSAGMQARAKGLEFVATLAVDVPPRILSDPLRLRQILLNLVSNAMKFTERGGVRVSVERGPDPSRSSVRISVRDTGIGVPADKQQVIFESFAQADVSTTRKYGGTGLGLAIVRQLVGLMGGQLGLDSAPGQGSTFWFVIPAEPAPDGGAAGPARASTAAAAAGPVRHGHILFAEDYPTNQVIARLFLEGAGHRVTVVSNGREAVDACAHTAFDLILMDLHMPIMDGQAAAAEVRRGATPNAAVPIVALTASADAETRAACPKYGINGVLTKPFRRETLLAAVQHWLSQAPLGPAGPQPPAPATHTPAPRESAPPLDWDAAIREFGGRAMVTGLTAQFLEHADARLAALRTAIESDARGALREAAHAIKGAAATLEAAPLAQCAAELETASATAEQAELLLLLRAVEVEMHRLSQYTMEPLGRPGDAEHAQPGNR